MVIDSSVAVKLLVIEEQSDAAEALIGQGLVAPDLIMIECGNALWKRVQRGETTQLGTAAALAVLPRLVEPVPSGPLADRALAIAIELRHPIYDCLFLACAEARDVALVTADQRLVNATANSSFAPLVRAL